MPSYCSACKCFRFFIQSSPPKMVYAMFVLIFNCLSNKLVFLLRIGLFLPCRLSRLIRYPLIGRVTVTNYVSSSYHQCRTRWMLRYVLIVTFCIATFSFPYSYCKYLGLLFSSYSMITHQLDVH
jgi:hypothetical protein